jgi:hypothetical protein
MSLDPIETTTSKASVYRPLFAQVTQSFWQWNHCMDSAHLRSGHGFDLTHAWLLILPFLKMI